MNQFSGQLKPWVAPVLVPFASLSGWAFRITGVNEVTVCAPGALRGAVKVRADSSSQETRVFYELVRLLALKQTPPDRKGERD